MRNPFRSEADAYRLVWLTIAYFVLIVVASLLNVWLGLTVFIVETAVVLWWVFLRRGEEAAPPREALAPSPEGERRILVIANETVGGRELLDCLERKAEGVDEKVLVVTPALNSPLRHWVSDEDAAEIGDGDPLQAIEDAVRTFRPDEVIISTHPEGRSHWLERGVVSRTRERFDVPVTHVVVDLEAQPNP